MQDMNKSPVYFFNDKHILKSIFLISFLWSKQGMS